MEIEASLIALYRLAQSLAPDRFPKAALGLASELISFDTAAWYVRSSRPARIGDIWTFAKAASDTNDARPLPRILLRDPCATEAVRYPGQVIRLADCGRSRVHSGTANSDSATAVGRFADSICIAVPDGVSGWSSVVSLQATDLEASFSEQDVQALRNFAPHMLEARAINRHLHLRVAAFDDRRTKIGLAWICDDGLPLAMDTHFRKMVSSDWPEWGGGLLPPQLVGAAQRTSKLTVIPSLRITSHRRYGMNRLELERVPPRPKLSERECEVVSSYVQGRTYRQIAHEIGVGENTVRTLLRRVFQKLRVHNKVELLRRWALEDSGLDE